MPTSNLYLAGEIIDMVRQALAENPRTADGSAEPWVLDVGPGRGKFGLLLREYLDRPLHINAVELEQSYVTDRLRCLYESVSVGDVTRIARHGLAIYDLVLMVDVLEHLTHDDGEQLLARIPGDVVICTPVDFFQNPETVPSEVHRSVWTTAELEAVGAARGSGCATLYESMGGVLCRLRPLP